MPVVRDRDPAPCDFVPRKIRQINSADFADFAELAVE
jgi:hypothetical protein